MNSMIQWLSEQCLENQLTEKWLLAEDLRIAQQWKDRINLLGHATINLHSKSIATTAVSLATNTLAEASLTFVGQSTSQMLIRGILCEYQDAGELEYFRKSKAESLDGLSGLFSKTIRDLRLASVNPEAFDVNDFESAGKAEDIRLILQSYTALLEDQRLVDYADCLRLAISGLQNGSIELPGELLILLPERPRFNSLERQLLDAMAAKARLVRAQESDAYEVAPEQVADTLSSDRDLVSYFAGVGEVNEIRGVFQRILSTQVDTPTRLDEVEILHTDYACYVPLVLEQLTGWLSEFDDEGSTPRDIDTLPVTFAEGIACIYSRPGRALRAWLRWARHDFVQTRLVQLIREGLLVRPDDGKQVAFSRLANSLRQIPIGFQADRYKPAIRQAIVSAQQSLQEFQSRREPDGASNDAGDLRHRDFGLQALETVSRMVNELIELAPGHSDDAKTILEKAKKFLARCTRVGSKLDRFARDRLSDDIDGMLACISIEPSNDLDVLGWLEELPIQSRMMASGSRPGCIHVAPLARGGHTGRPHMYVVGLDDGRYPRRTAVDPVILDSERQRISEELPTSSELSDDTRGALDRALHRALANGGTKICLAYAAKNLVDNRLSFPSPSMLELFRVTQCNDTAHLENLMKHVDPAVAFVSPNLDDHLSSTDRQLAALLHEPNQERRVQRLDEQTEYAQRQRIAADAHSSTTFGEYDGYVRSAGIDLDPISAKRLSPSRMETFGTCPRRYFFRHGLGIYPPDQWIVDQERWLDPLQFGNLVHELFEHFLAGLTEKGLTPDVKRDRVPLLNSLQSRIDDLKSRVPTPNEDVYRRTCDLLEEICEIFLDKEEQYCRENHARPWVLEASLGLESESNTELDCPDPIPLTLSDGRLLRFSGRIDRIDKLNADGSERYAIWDYKSGSSYGFDAEDPFKQGRKLQPFLYVGMLRHRISARGGLADQVESFGYFFPSPRTEGLRLQWTRAELRGGDAVLKHLCALMSEGVFLPTNEPRDCTYCDYLPVCGDAETVTRQSLCKSMHTGNKVLEPWRQLRQIDQQDEGRHECERRTNQRGE